MSACGRPSAHTSAHSHVQQHWVGVRHTAKTTHLLDSNCLECLAFMVGWPLGLGPDAWCTRRHVVLARPLSVHAASVACQQPWCCAAWPGRICHHLLRLLIGLLIPGFVARELLYCNHCRHGYQLLLQLTNQLDGWHVVRELPGQLRLAWWEDKWTCLARCRLNVPTCGPWSNRSNTDSRVFLLSQALPEQITTLTAFSLCLHERWQADQCFLLPPSSSALQLL